MQCTSNQRTTQKTENWNHMPNSQTGERSQKNRKPKAHNLTINILQDYIWYNNKQAKTNLRQDNK